MTINTDGNSQKLQQWTDELWQWSCHIYQNKEVAELCIAVQDTLGLNVNYMLMALWARQKNIPIGINQWELIQQDALPALDAVNYIRQKRVALKNKSEDAYQQALLIELKAEQQHQKQAIQSLFKQNQEVATIGDPEKNLQQYLEVNDISAEDQATVQQLGQLVEKVSL